MKLKLRPLHGQWVLLKNLNSELSTFGVYSMIIDDKTLALFDIIL